MYPFLCSLGSSLQFSFPSHRKRAFLRLQGGEMPSSGMVIPTSYNYGLVALSVCIAILASYAALDLASRVTSARGVVRMLWLNGGAIAMGFGIWSMHYVGMLALRLSVPVEYDWPTVLLSLLAAIHAAGVALYVTSRRKLRFWAAFFGSIFMGAGIAAMHYIGMAAMRLPAMCVYSPPIVILSVVLAIGISFLALHLTFYGRAETSWNARKKLGSALLMGAAIPVMHYTGMAAVSFTPSTLADQTLRNAVPVTSLGIFVIVCLTVIALAIVLVSSRIGRLFEQLAMKLDSTEQNYRQVVETSFDAFVAMDCAGIIQDWNPSAETLFGFSRSEALGRNFTEMILLEDDEEPCAENIVLLLHLVRTHIPRKPMEIEALHRDGARIPVELMVAPIDDISIPLFAAFVHNVADRKRAEQENKKARELSDAASRAKSEFLANMSHEIRTPLNGILGMADLVLDTDLNSEQREYLDTVKVSADALLTVINDILDFSKIEAGKVDLETADFNLRESLETMLRSLAFQAHKKGIELLFEIARDVPEIVAGDSNRLRQVIINLIGNAIKFTAHGEVELQVHVESTDLSGHTLKFSISDTGVGIPLEKQKSIFDPFSQADTSTTRKYGGTGLGLTISTRLVSMMGGKMWVISELGHGATFYFTVHLGFSNSTQVEGEPQVSAEIPKGTKVLVIDDNRTNRRILEEMMRGWEMIVSSTGNGEGAIAQLAAAADNGDPYSMILIAINVRETNGFTLIEQIRKVTSLATAKIIMLTASGQRGDAARCQELEVGAYLLKPVRQTELREAMARVLGGAGHTHGKALITRYSLQGARHASAVLRILLAEDNEVNQRLAARLLEKRGHRVSIAGNGRQAVATFEKQTFDLVLMDLQMPELDGFGATAEIREKEKNGYSRVPIIALTAHAMSGDREQCLAAGMDGYLTKPIRPQELDEMLAKYAEPQHVPIPESEVTPVTL
jgi:two-component system, sensor histidine kinase and response regulator